MNRISRRSLPVLIFVVTIFLDQFSKDLVLQNLEVGRFVDVVPNFFSLTLHYNPGVAFGMFADWSEPGRTIILTCSKFVALSLCLYLLREQYKGHLTGQVALSLILGGAIGNIVDRFRFGEVVDFLDVYFKDYHWPTFNIADSAICIGVGMLLLLAERKTIKTVRPAESEAESVS